MGAMRDTARAMSQENVETIIRLYDEFFSRPERVSDPGLLQFFDPAIEFRQSASILGTEGTFYGYDGMARGVREVFETFRDLHWVPIQLIDSGDHVVATVDTRAFGKHSGVEVNMRAGHVWTLRGGRIVALHFYMDPTQALEAVGLSEQDAHAN
jgi:ketosteroid isomerase-like protein